MGLPTAIFATMTSEQLEAYALHLRIEEISQKLRISDCVPADGDRYVLSDPPLSIETLLIRTAKIAVSPSPVRQLRSPC